MNANTETEVLVFHRQAQTSNGRKKVLYEDKHSGYGVYICSCKTDSNEGSVIVRGYDIPALSGCWLKGYGKWTTDPKTKRRSFSAFYTEIMMPTTKTGVISFLQSTHSGLGAARAQALYMKFEEKIWDVLRDTPERLKEVNGITSNHIKRLTRAIEEMNIKRELMKMFSGSEEFNCTVLSSRALRKCSRSGLLERIRGRCSRLMCSAIILCPPFERPLRGDGDRGPAVAARRLVLDPVHRVLEYGDILFLAVHVVPLLHTDFSSSISCCVLYRAYA